MTSNPPEELVHEDNRDKLRLLEARFGADEGNSNSQVSFDSPSLNYQPKKAGVPSWQRMQQQPPKSVLKTGRKQPFPRKSVVIVQESPPKGNHKTDSNQGSGGSNSGTTAVRLGNQCYISISKLLLLQVVSSNRRKRKAVAPIKRSNDVAVAKKQPYETNTSPSHPRSSQHNCQNTRYCHQNS